MQFFFYSRSERAAATGSKLIEHLGGERIDSVDRFVGGSFAKGLGDINNDNVVLVLILPAAAAVAVSERIESAAAYDFVIICVDPEGKYILPLRSTINCKARDVAPGMVTALGIQAQILDGDCSDYAPNLLHTIENSPMIPDNYSLAGKIGSLILDGEKVDVYTDLSIRFSEPSIDLMSFNPIFFRNDRREDFVKAYHAAIESGKPSIFVTYTRMPSTDNIGNTVVLFPRRLVLGVELTGRATADYSVEAIERALTNRNIDVRAIGTVAVSSSAKNDEVVSALADRFDAKLAVFEQRDIKKCKIPLNASYSAASLSAEHDTCTVCAYLGSDNGRILMRRVTDGSSAAVSLAVRKDDIFLTE